MNRSLGRNWLRVQIERWYVIEIGNATVLWPFCRLCLGQVSEKEISGE